ncbi:MAG TPA: LysM peptidoglycan-binding domain-containing protein [Woeseiaceae bacterium]|nr:LysM peptidoglycan-binding domain-containing protein [Woeseiaceae bacterium]
MTRLIRQLPSLFVLIFLPMAATQADDGIFPRPAELEPDVLFWRSVFTQYSTDEGVLHDNRNLAVVYETVPMPAATSRNERNRKVQRRREHYQEILRTLASGKRDGLNAEQQRVLALWPADVSNAELAAAAGRIRFQHGLSDRFREGLVRAGRWRDHVHQEFGRLGVPLQLAALPHVESSYNPEARSHVGASGIWQFTRSTGRRFMQVDHVLDERNDPFLATSAAARLLAYNHSIAGNWPMAITAYNHGLAGVRRAMRAHGDTALVDILRNYNGRTFGFASRNFYVAFLAAMEVDQNPQKFFPGLVPDKPVNYALAALPDYVPADAVAAALGITERELAQHNPAVQATVWQGSKYLPRDFEIRVPAQMLAAPMAQMIAAIPQDYRYAHQLPDLYHTIERGDTLSALAAEYGTSVSTLVALNGLNSSHRIRAGQQLRLPAAGPAPVAVAAEVPAVAAVEIPAEAAETSGTEVPATATGKGTGEIATKAGAEVPAEVATEMPAVASAEEAEPEPPAGAMATAPAIGAVTDDMLVSEGALIDDTGVAEADPSQTNLLSDPSDYTVGDDSSIEVQPLETLGHYADWLGIRTQRLRDINGLAFRTPVEVGQRIRLDLSVVNAETFENLRTSWHRQQQDAFFRNHRISGTVEHVVRQGESVWILSLRTYDVPVWLFRQYNPELDLRSVRPGTRLSFPVLETIDESS